ncbi:hypothetical protein CHUAL_012124 [Chamberlinius hualienensis]
MSVDGVVCFDRHHIVYLKQLLTINSCFDIMDFIFHPTHWYNYLWKFRDERIDSYLLMGSIKPTLALITVYFLMVIYGPKWMKNKQPMNLKFFVFVYNIAIAILNLHIFLELATVSYRLSYNWWCEPVRKSTDPEEMRLVNALHYYLMSKVIEFLDTFFIIVRKKTNQLTFLHVYHHSSMLLLCWVVGRWIPGGNGALGALTNSFVHVVMYSYYGLSVLGPTVTKYLWWKRYITILQLAQFLLGLVIGINFFIYGCKYTKWMQYMTVGYTLSYLVLFGRFYITAYINKGQKKMMTSSCKSDECHQQKSIKKKFVD